MGVTDGAGRPIVPQIAQNFLRIIADPTDQSPPGDIEVDIIAVHGLKPSDSYNHAEDTWTKGSKLWLRDFLPQELPSARIFLFGYDADFAIRSSSGGVLDQAMNLLDSIRAKRRKEKSTNRPIIFVAHSLGGVVVKRALVVANALKRYKAIREATYGIVFFGTPHRASGSITLGQIASNIVRAVHRETPEEFLAKLQKDPLFANTVVEEFRTQLEDFRVISFYETRAITDIGVVVDYRSAWIGLSPELDSNQEREVALPLDLDHRNICKFETHDEVYDRVSENIVELVQDAISDSKTWSIASPASPDPTSPDPAVSPLIDEDDPDETQETLEGLGIQEVDTRLDALSISSSIERGSRGATESTVDIQGDLRRQSTSTSMTSSPSLGVPGASQGKYTTQSPRLAASIKMNLSDTVGKTLRSAAAAGDKHAVMALLQQGAPIDNSGVWDGYTALADAARHGQEGVVELLLNEGANPAFNCLHSTSKFGTKENTPLALAAGHGHLSCMRLLLERHQYEKKDLDKAFRAAKYKSRTDAMKLIQEYGGGRY